jgi:hypothetical protein
MAITDTFREPGVCIQMLMMGPQKAIHSVAATYRNIQKQFTPVTQRTIAASAHHE